MNEEKGISKKEVPVVPGTFKFSLRAGTDSADDLGLRIDAMLERIKTIDNRASLKTDHGGDFPVIQQLINICDDSEAIGILGKALVRVSEIMPELKELQDRKRVIDVLKNNPAWFMATYADFSEDVEQLIHFTEPTDNTK